MRAMNFLTAIFFAVDTVVKMTAKGVILTPTAYFQVWETGRVQSSARQVALLECICELADRRFFVCAGCVELDGLFPAAGGPPAAEDVLGAEGEGSASHHSSEGCPRDDSAALHTGIDDSADQDHGTCRHTLFAW